MCIQEESRRGTWRSGEEAEFIPVLERVCLHASSGPWVEHGKGSDFELMNHEVQEIAY